MFFSETTFLLVKATWGFEKHQWRSSFLNLRTGLKIYDQVSSFDRSPKNWKERKIIPPPNKAYLGGRGVKHKNNFSQFSTRTPEYRIKNLYNRQKQL